MSHLLERGATGILWVEARGVVGHLIQYRTASQNLDYLAPNVNSAEVEKLYPKGAFYSYVFWELGIFCGGWGLRLTGVVGGSYSLTGLQGKWKLLRSIGPFSGQVTSSIIGNSGAQMYLI